MMSKKPKAFPEKGLTFQKTALLAKEGTVEGPGAFLFTIYLQFLCFQLTRLKNGQFKNACSPE